MCEPEPDAGEVSGGRRAATGSMKQRLLARFDVLHIMLTCLASTTVFMKHMCLLGLLGVPRRSQANSEVYVRNIANVANSWVFGVQVEESMGGTPPPKCFPSTSLLGIHARTFSSGSVVDWIRLGLAPTVSSVSFLTVRGWQ